MRAILTAIVFSLSLTAFAKVTALEGAKTLVAGGTYLGQKCKVEVTHGTDSSRFEVSSEYGSDSFTVMNAESGSRYAASYDAVKGELAATTSLNFPRHYNGGSKSLYVKKEVNGSVTASISQTLLDVRGNDNSTFITCTFTK